MCVGLVGQDRELLCVCVCVRLESEIKTRKHSLIRALRGSGVWSANGVGSQKTPRWSHTRAITAAPDALTKTDTHPPTPEKKTKKSLSPPHHCTISLPPASPLAPSLLSSLPQNNRAKGDWPRIGPEIRRLSLLFLLPFSENR